MIEYLTQQLAASAAGWVGGAITTWVWIHNQHHHHHKEHRK